MKLEILISVLRLDTYPVGYKKKRCFSWTVHPALTKYFKLSLIYLTWNKLKTKVNMQKNKIIVCWHWLWQSTFEARHACKDWVYRIVLYVPPWIKLWKCFHLEWNSVYENPWVILLLLRSQLCNRTLTLQQRALLPWNFPCHLTESWITFSGSFWRTQQFIDIYQPHSQQPLIWHGAT